MILEHVLSFKQRVSAPRTSGDDPESIVCTSDMVACSPHERG